MPRLRTSVFAGLAVASVVLSVASFARAQEVIIDNREASFMPSPVLKGVGSAVKDGVTEISVPGEPSAVGAVPSPDAAASAVAQKTNIETSVLEQVDPDAAGILSPANGGLGSSMWQDTPRAMVERLIPELGLPAASPTLNNLARRLLLTTAEVPKGNSISNRSLTAIRVEKLLALGDGVEAWQLAHMVKPDRIDDLTLRMVIETLLINGDSKSACEIIPSLLASHNSPEWQKLLVVCQLRSGDSKAAQLSVDIMREQAVRDDVFIALVNKNILGTSKQLPRQLTPLKPVNVALLIQTDLPLPQEVFVRADAAFVQALLKAKASNEAARLEMAERAAARGLISSADLAAVYKSVDTKKEAQKNVKPVIESQAGLRALLYQEILLEQETSKQLDLVVQFVRSTDGVALGGTMGQLLADIIKNIPIRNEYWSSAPYVARTLALAGKPDLALGWIKLARSVVSSSPDVAAQLHALWPLIVVSGLVTDEEYGKNLDAWLDSALQSADREKRQQIGSALLLFSASGFAVPEDAWGKVADVKADGKRIVPPSAVLLDRLRMAGISARKGEAALLSTLIASEGAGETPVFAMIEAIRALRLAGLSAEAQGLARETASTLFPLAVP